MAANLKADNETASAFAPSRRRIEVQSGALVQHPDGVFRIDDVLDFDTVTATSVESGRIVGVGTRDAVRVLHTDPQHASRFDVISLPKWELNKDFQTLVAGFESVLPLKRQSDLSNPELATALHTICDGNLGDLHRLLVECTINAITEGTEQITMDIVQSNQWLKPTKGHRELVE